MKGIVCRMPITHSKIDEHPHVVALVVRKECLLVPAFSPNGPAVLEFISGYERMALTPHRAYVEIDNAKHVTPLAPGFTWHKSWWVTAQWYRQPTHHVSTFPQIGRMDDAGLKLIANGLLEVVRAKPDIFDRRIVDLLSRMVDGAAGPATLSP